VRMSGRLFERRLSSFARVAVFVVCLPASIDEPVTEAGEKWTHPGFSLPDSCTSLNSGVLRARSSGVDGHWMRCGRVGVGVGDGESGSFQASLSLRCFVTLCDMRVDKWSK
jgi:hypothetical protein